MNSNVLKNESQSYAQISPVFFLLPLTCHNIQSFKRKHKQERQEPGEKFKKKWDEQSPFPCIYLNHDNKKLPSSD